MPTQDAIVPIELEGGMDTGSSLKSTLGKELLENVTMTDRSHPIKRNGVTDRPTDEQGITGVTNVTNGVWLLGDGKKEVLGDGTYARQWSEHEQAWIGSDFQTSAGSHLQVSDILSTDTVRQNTIPLTGDELDDVVVTAITDGDRELLAYYDTVVVFVMRDVVTGAILATEGGDINLPSNFAQVIIENGFFTGVYWDTTSREIKAVRFDANNDKTFVTLTPSDINTGSPGTKFAIASDENPDPGSSPNMILAYTDDSEDLHLYIFDDDLAVANSDIQSGGAYSYPDLLSDGVSIWVCAFQGDSLEMLEFDLFAGLQSINTSDADFSSTFGSLGMVRDADTIWVTVSIDLAGGSLAIQTLIVAIFDTTLPGVPWNSSGATIPLHNFQALHKPVLYNSALHVTATYIEENDDTDRLQRFATFLIRYELNVSSPGWVVVCPISLGDRLFHTAAYSPALSQMTSINDTLRIPFYVSDIQTFNETRSGVGKMAIISDSQSISKEVYGENVYLSNGYVQEFDGSSFYESGFWMPPKIVDHDATGSGNTYTYVVVFEFVDNHQQYHVSALSGAVTLESTNAITTVNPITLTITTLQLSFKRNVKISVYRTGDALFEYRFVGSIGSNSSEATVSFEDGVPDTALGSTLYTGFVAETTELANIAPEPCISLVNHNNRMFGVSLFDSRKIVYSKSRIEGRSLEWNDTLNLFVDRDKVGQQTGNSALASIENYLIVFKETSIFAIGGDGPNNLGVGGTFTPPILVADGVGCIDSSSVVVTPQGAVFKSAKGFHIVTRGLQVVDIGEGISSKDEDTILRAELHPTKSLAYFLTDQGEFLILDYEDIQNPFKWSIFTGFTGAVDFIFSDGLLKVLNSDGVVQIENTDFDDNGSFISQRITTGWLRVGELSSYQRVKRLFITGEYKSDHTLKVELSYDFEDYISDTITLNPLTPLNEYEVTVKPSDAVVNAGGNRGVYEFDVHIPRQKCTAIKITLYDEEANGVQGESFQLEGLSLLVGAKKGHRKINESKKG